MTTIELADASGPLADYVRRSRSGPLVVTEGGVPTAVLLPLDNTDLDTVSLSYNPEFLALIERSRARLKTEGGIPAAEMRRRLASEP